jgi:glycogen(starch) synthase
MSNDKPTRILMTADTVGGVWTYALELARALQPYNIEVLLAVMGPPLSSGQQEDAHGIPNVSLFKSNYRLEWMPDCWPDVKHAGDWLVHLASRLSPDVIHLNGYVHANLPWDSPTLVVGHSCVFSWWQAVKQEKPPSDWEQYKTEVTNGLRAADLVVTPSTAMLRALKTQYGPLKNTRVIYNGRNPEQFNTAPKRPFILSAGRLWDPAKNIDRVVRLGSELPWPVLVAGDFQHPDESAYDDAVEKRCRWLGSLSESQMRGWYSSASIYALPALYEPFGYTPLEAALCGCALVLSDIESLREIWRDAAVFVDPHDNKALKSGLLQLIANGRHRQDMSVRARKRARKFTSARMGQNYLGAYQELLEAKAVGEAKGLAQCA